MPGCLSRRCRPQVGDRGEGLDGLAEAHLVADDHPPLRQGEPGAERLVAAQGRRDEGQVKRLVADPFSHLGRKEALSGFLVRAEAGDVDEQAVVGDRAGEEVAPQRGRVGCPGRERRRDARPQAGGRLGCFR